MVAIVISITIAKLIKNFHIRKFSCTFFHVFLELFFCQNNPPLFSDNDGLFDDNAGLFLRKKLWEIMGNFQIVLAKVFAAKRQLVVHQRGQYLLQLQEQSFARLIAIGVHVEGGFMFLVPSFK